jgi:hypothetical protein
LGPGADHRLVSIIDRHAGRSQLKTLNHQLPHVRSFITREYDSSDLKENGTIPF